MNSKNVEIEVLANVANCLHSFNHTFLPSAYDIDSFFDCLTGSIDVNSSVRRIVLSLPRDMPVNICNLLEV